MVSDQANSNIRYIYRRVEYPERSATGGESKGKVEGQFYFYILECGDNSLYCGSSHDLVQRLKAHNSGKAAEWTKIRRPVQLVYFEVYNNLLAARQRELQVKGWVRVKKENLITGVWGKQTQM